MDDEVGMELIELLDGAALTRQLGDSGGETAGGDRGLEGKAWVAHMGGDVLLF
jgi:hypothetical protein